MNSQLAGVLPVVHMPYLNNMGIDYGTLEHEIDYAFSSGANGICLALVSDLFRLTADERIQLPKQLCSMANERGPVIINVAAESSMQACEYARAAEAGGSNALMVIPPISRPLSENQLRAYFDAILESVKIPVFIQDASSYIGNPMSIEFQAKLYLDYGDRILFKPEASPLGPCLSALSDATKGRAALFEGSGGLLLIDSFRRGITGTIPGVELLDGTVALWEALSDGDEDRAYRLYFPICALATLQLQGGLDGFIVCERYIMHKRGLFPKIVHREPLSFQLDAHMTSEIDRLLSKLSEALES
ncbi:MAG: dihydrodipicolinate synthase family protein [Candidatus Latescibacterota bacterium]|nr:dihydrodipicolinate synthase family protein [Candidatus Latescibacterota bacterium]